jgi:hypothetical protein
VSTTPSPLARNGKTIAAPWGLAGGIPRQSGQGRQPHCHTR